MLSHHKAPQGVVIPQLCHVFTKLQATLHELAVGTFN